MQENKFKCELGILCKESASSCSISICICTAGVHRKGWFMIELPDSSGSLVLDLTLANISYIGSLQQGTFNDSHVILRRISCTPRSLQKKPAACMLKQMCAVCSIIHLQAGHMRHAHLPSPPRGVFYWVPSDSLPILHNVCAALLGENQTTSQHLGQGKVLILYTAGRCRQFSYCWLMMASEDRTDWQTKETCARVKWGEQKCRCSQRTEQ